jgi:arylsulfatase A-like enzyme
MIAAGAVALMGALFRKAFGADRMPGLGLWQVLLAAAGLALLRKGLLGRVLPRGADGEALALPSLVCLAACTGIAAGLGETAQHLCHSFLFGPIAWRSHQVTWMAPAGNAVVLVLAVLAAWSLARIRGRSLRGELVAFALAFLALWSQFFDYPRLHDASVFVVCLGGAVVMYRWAVAHPGRLRPGPGALLALLAVVVITTLGVEWARSSAPTLGASTEQHGSARRPNVVLIVLDTVRADHVGLHGYPRDTTPNLDRLAERSVVFEQAFAPSPWTVPSHVAMFTGRFPHETGVPGGLPFRGEHPVLAEFLARHGYATAGFVGNLHCCCPGWGLAHGFAHYEDFQPCGATLLMMAALPRILAVAAVGNRYTELLKNDAEVVTEAFLRWVDGERARPFFAFLNYFDAHALCLPPEPHATRFGPRSPLLEQWYLRSDWAEAEVRGFVDAYDGAIAFIDAEVGRLLAHLRASGELDDTLIVVTSDHGEQFGEHGLFDHANSLYRQLLHVPLVMSLPGRIDGGVRVADRVSLRDLPRTIVTLLGLARDAPFPGATLLAGPEAQDQRADSLVFAEHPGWLSLIADGMHYLVTPKGEQIYDAATDPAELHDLIATPAGEAAARRAKERILRLLAEHR